MRIFGRIVLVLLCCSFLSLSFAQPTPSFTINCYGPYFLKKFVAVLGQAYTNQHKPINIRYIDSRLSDTMLATIEEKADFGLIAYPQTPQQLDQNRLLQTPILLYGIVPVVNIAGVKPNKLVLSQQILADIFTKKITYWDDPLIHNVNPTLMLPHAPILPVPFVSNCAITRFVTEYLKIVDRVHLEDLQPCKIVQRVKNTKNSIGFVPYYIANDAHLSWTKLLNRNGVIVSPNTATFQAALLNSDWMKAKNFSKTLLNERGDNSWPLTAAVYVIMHRTALLKPSMKEALNFIEWIYKNDQIIKIFDYSTLPDVVVPQVANYFRSIITVLGLTNYPLRALFPSVKPISTADLYKLFEKKQVEIVDVRSKVEYGVIHIKHSLFISFASSDFLPKLQALSAKRGDKPIVLYCNGTTCAKSYRGVELAEKQGIQNIYVYDAGVGEWALQHPNETILFGKLLGNTKNLISQAQFAKKNLDYSTFKSKQIETGGLLVDIRESVQRRLKLTERQEAKHRLLKSKKVLWLPSDKFVKVLEEGKYKDRTLYIFDAVGKQVQWIQYYLDQYGYKNYWFLKGGVRTALGEEKHF